MFDDGTVVEHTPNNARQTHVGGCMPASARDRVHP
ncbi:hypothetical protein BIFADO_00102 [Bifidobacterium adolescentis L2-32]|uniref:Uncharacterized protein n=1 Tax=Bifidobacterium adolescentis L2-32 TaxID=411481 RepID=A7A2S2_BIFAD|nr:hypothetical protein BIFADO_00102 [Bifidobacterium adolescentis L2-32]